MISQALVEEVLKYLPDDTVWLEDKLQASHHVDMVLSMCLFTGFQQTSHIFRLPPPPMPTIDILRRPIAYIKALCYKFPHFMGDGQKKVKLSIYQAFSDCDLKKPEPHASSGLFHLNLTRSDLSLLFLVPLHMPSLDDNHNEGTYDFQNFITDWVNFSKKAMEIFGLALSSSDAFAAVGIVEINSKRSSSLL